MFCPVCKAEYRDGYTHCADCDMDLVLSLPIDPEYGEHDPFVTLWSGGPGQMLVEIRQTLDEARIPFRLIESKDTLFNVSYRAPYEVAVPPTQIEKAREALGWNVAPAATGGDTPAEIAEDATEYELPEEEGADKATRPVDPNQWNPEEATEVIWAGEHHDDVEMITASLSENGIHWRIDDGTGHAEGDEDHDDASHSEPDANLRTEIFVLPEDSDRAKEIIREISGAEPL